MNLQQLKEITQNLSVLYVEDDKVIMKQIKSFLFKLFGRVDIALNGEDGLIKFKDNKYDLIITDITMPVMNGIEMIKEIKAINDNQSIIAMSSHSKPEYTVPLINLGVDRFILKPFEIKLFLAVLSKVCGAISEHYEKESLQQEVDIKNNEIEAILDLVDIGVIRIDIDKVYHANARAYKLLGVDSLEQIQVKLDDMASLLVDAPGYLYAQNILELIQKSKNLGKQNYKLLGSSKMNERVFLFSANSINKTNRYVINFKDITLLEQQEMYNDITALPNSLYLAKSIQDFVKRDCRVLAILLSIKTFDAIIRWHGAEASQTAEANVAHSLLEFIDNLPFRDELFLSNPGKNRFVILSCLKNLDRLRDELKNYVYLFSERKDSTSETKKVIELPLKKVIMECEDKDPNEIQADIEVTFDKMLI